MTHYNKLLSLAVTEKADCIVIGGDILPRARSLVDLLDVQRKFIIYHLRPLFERFREANHETTIYLMMGNDDFAVNMDMLEEMDAEGLIKLLHLRAYHLAGNLYIAGYGCVPPTPFMIKDWERLDGERSEVPARSYEACTSSRDGLEYVNVRDWLITHNTINEDLKILAGMSDPGNTAYVMHTPPFGTTLDVLYNGLHVGSRSVRCFIEDHKPPLTLHGHIHESRHMTNQLADSIGRSICVNAGQSEDMLHAVVIDIPGYTVRPVGYSSAGDLYQDV